MKRHYVRTRRNPRKVVRKWTDRDLVSIANGFTKQTVPVNTWANGYNWFAVTPSFAKRTDDTTANRNKRGGNIIRLLSFVFDLYLYMSREHLETYSEITTGGNDHKGMVIEIMVGRRKLYTTTVIADDETKIEDWDEDNYPHPYGGRDFKNFRVDYYKKMFIPWHRFHRYKYGAIQSATAGNDAFFVEKVVTREFRWHKRMSIKVPCTLVFDDSVSTTRPIFNMPVMAVRLPNSAESGFNNNMKYGYNIDYTFIDLTDQMP